MGLTPTQYQQAAFDRLVSKIPARYRVKTTKYLQGLLQALAAGDGIIDSTIDAVHDNLLVVSATGLYLDRLGSLYGVVRGTANGILDDDFRQLIPIMGMSPKQIMHSLQRLVDVVYGPYASHANTTCAAPEPYALSPGDSLTIRVDDSQYTCYFQNGDAANLAQATANEIATAITLKTNGKIIGSVVSNSITGDNFINIRTSTIGPQGFIQVLGGEAQTAARFPEVRNTRQNIATWNVTRDGGSANMIYTAVSGVSPGLVSGQVKSGDYVTIKSNSGFHSANTGTFQIIAVQEDSFMCTNSIGVTENGITQTGVDDFTFFRPDLGNILLASNPATILQTGNKELTIILPATSPILKKTLVGSHHFHGGYSVAVDATTNTLTLSNANGFAPSGSLQVIASRLNSNGICSTVLSNTITLIDASTWPTQGAAYSNVTQQFYFYSGISGNILTGVTPSPPSSLAGSPLYYSEKYSYTSISGNVLNGVYPDPTQLVGLEIVANTQIIANYPGSFLYDGTSTFSAGSPSANITQSIQQGSSNTVISVTGLDSTWPATGYFVLEFATQAQEGPIKYLGKVGTQALIVDPSYVYRRDHLSGCRIRLVNQLGPYIPKTDGTDYPVYLTATSAARSLVLEYLQIIMAAGIALNVKIQIPSQEWPILPLLQADNPLDSTLS